MVVGFRNRLPATFTFSTAGQDGSQDSRGPHAIVAQDRWQPHNNKIPSTELPHPTPSVAMNRSSDYKSNLSTSFPTRPSRAVEPPFPVPETVDMVTESPKRRSPIHRVAKLNVFSKLFTASRRDFKDSKKPTRDDLDRENSGSRHSSLKTATSTTIHLSRDAAQVFNSLRQQKQQSTRREMGRQPSDNSMIGSVLAIPSSSHSVDRVHHATEHTYPESPPTPPRPRVHHSRTASFRIPTRAPDLERAPSVRSVSYPVERAAAATLPTIPSSEPPAPRIEISPGNHQVLRGHKETLRYVRRDAVASATCLFCQDTVFCVNDAALVVCPTCRSISPLGDDGHGLALGFSGHEWLEIQREALAMQ